jgi:hypothetical protein
MTGSGGTIGTELIKADDDGRYIIITAKIGDNRIKIGGYYGPNKDDTTTLDKMLTELDEVEAEHTILMGDFNFTMNPKMDKKGITENNHTKCRNNLINWMEDHDLSDIWRTRNLETRMYTWRSNTKPPIFCRLDFFIVSPSIINNCQRCKIGPGIRSDHSYVDLEVSFTSPTRGRGFWKFDNSLLEDKNFIKELTSKIKQTEEDNIGTEPTLLWETIKSAIRGECISYNSKRKRKLDNTIQELEKEIRIEEEKIKGNDEDTETQENRRKELQHQLESHVETKGRWEASKSRSLIYELGEKPNKYFLNQGKERSANNVIRRLVKDNGQEITNAEEIMKEQQDFYKRIYTSTLTNNNCVDKEEIGRTYKDIDQLDTPKIDKEHWETLTSEITEKELWKIIQTSADNKSPGTDGLNNNFYKAMWPHIKKYLLLSIQTTLKKGEMSISQKQGIISLIPKANKDTSKLKNWRPITLLNQDYKYLAKCLANRCKEVLPDIISPDQTGFVPNRLIGTNIIKSQSIITYLQEQHKEGLMMCIDFEKAFDTIEWSYIKKSLNHFNFPPIIVNWIETLYNNISTCIINNGHTSTFFHPTRGVRQGCPLSPILFVIAVELMAAKIRQNNKIRGIYIGRNEIKLSQFADDTTFFLEPDMNSINTLFNTLNDFAKTTGLKINKEKTEILLLGNTSPTDLDREMRTYIRDSIKALGVHICLDKKKMIQLNYEPVIEKIKNSIKFWQNRGLTEQGKIVIIKTLLISKLVYAINVIPSPPEEKIKEIEDMLYKFLWDNKPDKIKRDTLIGTYEDGGLKMPDLMSKIKSLKTAWMVNLAKKEGNWKNYMKDKLPLKDPNYFMECNIIYADIPNKPSKEDFWSEVLINWCILNREHSNKKDWSLEDIYQENLWWNSRIKVNKKVVEYREWGEKGIKKVCHLLNNQGTWLGHSELQDKYNIKTPFTKLLGIQSAIKESWGDITKMDITEPDPKGNRLVDKLGTKKKESQVLYWMLVDKKKKPPTTKRLKWEKDLEEEIPIRDWQRHLITSRKLNESTKLQTWTYKYNMRIIPYNTRLHEMGLVPSPICNFCSKEPETIHHLYWSCSEILVIRKHLENQFGIKINKKLGLLGLNNKEYNKIPGLYMHLHLARYYIHLCKCRGETPKTIGYTNLIKSIQTKDWGTATRNNTKKKYVERWGERDE